MADIFTTPKKITDMNEWHDYLEESLMGYVKEYITDDADIAKIKRAYNFAFKAHFHAERDSKEPDSGFRPVLKRGWHGGYHGEARSY